MFFDHFEQHFAYFFHGTMRDYHRFPNKRDMDASVEGIGAAGGHTVSIKSRLDGRNLQHGGVNSNNHIWSTAITILSSWLPADYRVLCRCISQQSVLFEDGR